MLTYATNFIFIYLSLCVQVWLCKCIRKMCNSQMRENYTDAYNIITNEIKVRNFKVQEKP